MAYIKEGGHEPTPLPPSCWKLILFIYTKILKNIDALQIGTVGFNVFHAFTVASV